MLDYAQKFEDFAGALKPMDLALYAGVGLVLFVLFKDKLSPVQKIVLQLVEKIKTLIGTSIPKVSVVTKSNNEDLFFQLVTSWKQTRDLAQESGCVEAVRVADQMFPLLSPNTCGKERNE
jgi:hypothetical protein